MDLSLPFILVIVTDRISEVSTHPQPKRGQHGLKDRDQTLSGQVTLESIFVTHSSGCADGNLRPQVPTTWTTGGPGDERQGRGGLPPTPGDGKKQES